MARIYRKDTPFRPEAGAPESGWDIEVKNSAGTILWFGESEHELDLWRQGKVFRKSWTVRLRIMRDGWCVGCYKWSGTDYVQRREAELAPSDNRIVRKAIARVWERVSANMAEIEKQYG